MNNKEIEIKVKIGDQTPLLKFLDEEGVFEFENYQRDEYFTPAHRNFIESNPIKEWFRLREQEGRCSLNYKDWQYNDEGRSYHCDEFETKVENPESMRKILEVLNFKSLVVVDKSRKQYKFNDYIIAIDRVVDLGDFVEVEYIGSEGDDVKVISEKMIDFLKLVGCENIEQDFLGYPWLLLIKKYGLKSV